MEDKKRKGADAALAVVAIVCVVILASPKASDVTWEVFFSWDAVLFILLVICVCIYLAIKIDTK